MEWVQAIVSVLREFGLAVVVAAVCLGAILWYVKQRVKSDEAARVAKAQSDDAAQAMLVKQTMNLLENHMQHQTTVLDKTATTLDQALRRMDDWVGEARGAHQAQSVVHSEQAAALAGMCSALTQQVAVLDRQSRSFERMVERYIEGGSR